MNIFSAIKSFLDKIFAVPISFLDLAIEKLRGVGLVTAQGLNFSQYMSIFRDLPAAWQLVISSLLLSMVLLSSLVIVRALIRMYFTAKSGVKWW